MNTSLHRILVFVVVILLQCFIFSRFSLGTYVQPSIYILFILFLPFAYSRVKTLLWAFLLGFLIDLFTSDVIGVNIAAVVAIAYFRPYILKLFSTKMDFDAYVVPNARVMGKVSFIGYILLCVLVFHVLFFFIDSFGFYDISHTLLRILLSTLCSFLLIILLQTLIPGKYKAIVS